MKNESSKSSRQRYRRFVADYKERRLGAIADAADGRGPASDTPASETTKGATPGGKKAKRRAYLREYVKWLWPHRWSVGGLFLFALVVAGLEMVEPLFMQFIIDDVLLN